MFKKIQIKSIVIGLLFLIGCTQTSNEIENQSEGILKNEEWFNNIESTKTYYFKEKKVNYIDSLSLYFMNSNAPEVISNSKYIFWNDGQKKRSGEFNFFERIDDTLFIAVSWRKRSVNIEEYRLSNSQLNVSNKIVFDMNENEFKNACYEITNLNETILNKNIKLSLHINESCINENIIKELYLKL